MKLNSRQLEQISELILDGNKLIDGKKSTNDIENFNLFVEEIENYEDFETALNKMKYKYEKELGLIPLQVRLKDFYNRVINYLKTKFYGQNKY